MPSAAKMPQTQVEKGDGALQGVLRAREGIAGACPALRWAACCGLGVWAQGCSAAGVGLYGDFFLTPETVHTVKKRRQKLEGEEETVWLEQNESEGSRGSKGPGGLQAACWVNLPSGLLTRGCL